MDKKLFPSSENLIELSPRPRNPSMVPRRPPPPPPTFNSNSSKPNPRSKTLNMPSSSDLINFDSLNLIDQHSNQNNIDVSYDRSSAFKSYISNPVPQENNTIKRIGASSFMDTFGEREEIMKHCMAKRQDEYTIKTPFRIFVGTWNVNGQSPSEPLKEWLAWEKEPPDIYLIGFQELDLSKEAFVFADSSREEVWLKAVRDSLHSDVKYVFVKLVRLVGMMVLVFSQVKHSSHITNIIAHQVGTGLLGKMGNKGGVGVRFDLHSSSFCAVNSHLAAHAEEVQRRNQDFRDICQRLRFENEKEDVEPLSVFEHDILFWFGDLNYRIEKIAPEIVKQNIEDKQYKMLQEYDQLHQQRLEKKVFENFQEGEINFRPTYKYNTGTDQWDSSEKFRTPAWCDRILWKEPNLKIDSKQAVTQLLYRSHPSLKISDHKPVSSVFKVDVKIVDDIKYRKVYEDEIRRLDRLENDHLPTMELSSQQIEFGQVKFQQGNFQSIILSNTGQSPCHFDFIPKPGEQYVCKPWLTITKTINFLLPGEKLTVKFEVYVNKDSAPSLNNMTDSISDILILHLKGGKDFFITLNGAYTPSCFGCSIEALCRIKMPIQYVDKDEIARLSKISSMQEADDQKIMQIPKELYWLIDHLFDHAKYQPNLFQEPGLHEEFLIIQEALDSKMPLKNSFMVSNHSVVEALLIFLEALPEPVIPFAYYLPFVNSYSPSDTQQCIELIKTMSPRHLNVFNYIMSFLHEILKFKLQNDVTVDLLASIFSAVMIRPSAKERRIGMDQKLNRMHITSIFKRLLSGT